MKEVVIIIVLGAVAIWTLLFRGEPTMTARIRVSLFIARLGAGSQPSGGVFLDTLERLRQENAQLEIEIKLLAIEKQQLEAERAYLRRRLDSLETVKGRYILKHWDVLHPPKS